MKQLKKVQLQDAKELTNNQMKNITGGGPTSGSSCSNYSQSVCNGECIDMESEDNIGRCTWVSAWNRCACAVVAVGK